MLDDGRELFFVGIISRERTVTRKARVKNCRNLYARKNRHAFPFSLTFSNAHGIGRGTEDWSSWTFWSTPSYEYIIYERTLLVVYFAIRVGDITIPRTWRIVPWPQRSRTLPPYTRPAPRLCPRCDPSSLPIPSRPAALRTSMAPRDSATLPPPSLHAWSGWASLPQSDRPHAGARRSG